MIRHKVVSRMEWLRARNALLVQEKKFTRDRDRLAEKRRNLPWVRVDKDYHYDGPDGRQTLAQLFGKKSQLIVYHFMFAPGWGEGCPHCSFWADHYDAMLPHLSARDTGFVVVSRAPLAEIKPFQKRVGWRFKWVSSNRNDFNYDYQVSFARGIDIVNTTYHFLDLVPKGRDERGLGQYWVRYHDKYKN